jgi:hypothetical protein
MWLAYHRGDHGERAPASVEPLSAPALLHGNELSRALSFVIPWPGSRMFDVKRRAGSGFSEKSKISPRLLPIAIAPGWSADRLVEPRFRDFVEGNPPMEIPPRPGMNCLTDEAVSV